MILQAVGGKELQLKNMRTELKLQRLLETSHRKMIISCHQPSLMMVDQCTNERIFNLLDQPD